ncbi:MAG: FAD-dependent oxidoreductase [Rhodospirillales bacterium]|nr:FAD-dependent oxidoreductase [Rhodospirillales bacterium]
MNLLRVGEFDADAETDVLVVGAGAAGLTAALSAHAMGVETLLLERDDTPTGSTSLSSGLVPAAGTRFQHALGIDDDGETFFADIIAKNGDQTDAARARRLAEVSAEAVEFLADAADVPFSVVEGFTYPGHSVLRMHGTPQRTGAELMGHLLPATERAAIPLVTSACVVTLAANGAGRILGVEVERPDGGRERIACQALILACGGFGANAGRVRAHIPSMTEALYFGHPGHRGDAVAWGEALGARLADLAGHQGHGSVAHPHGILITWAAMSEGGIQVNHDGIRFADESHGYSEHAAAVLAQPGGEAIAIFDARIAGIARQFEDFRNAEALGAVRVAADAAAIASLFALPEAALSETLAEVDALAVRGGRDAFGRTFSPRQRLTPPYLAVRVTGALFHTQGGLDTDPDARVLGADLRPLPNLFAAGGAARGVSGPHADGYLSGNGLLSAVGLGRIAGLAAGKRA